jgi:hypothetical protein
MKCKRKFKGKQDLEKSKTGVKILGLQKVNITKSIGATCPATCPDCGV